MSGSNLVFCGLREYPRGLGKALVSLMKKNDAYTKLEPTLRQKYDVSGHKTTMDLFKSLPMKDIWSDAKLRECYMYLWGNKNLLVPREWRDTMRAFTDELKGVAWL